MAFEARLGMAKQGVVRHGKARGERREAHAASCSLTNNAVLSRVSINYELHCSI
jgi:hypothetical protein